MSSIQPIAKINQHYAFFSHHPKPQSHLSFFFGWLPYHLASFPSYHSSMDQCVYNKVHVSFPPSDLHDEKNRLWQFLRCLIFGTPNKWACPTPLIAGLETLWDCSLLNPRSWWTKKGADGYTHPSKPWRHRVIYYSFNILLYSLW